MLVTMVMIVALSASCDSKALIHGNKSNKTDQYRNSKEEILVRVDEDKSCFIRRGLSEENLWQKVKDSVS